MGFVVDKEDRKILKKQKIDTFSGVSVFEDRRTHVNKSFQDILTNFSDIFVHSVEKSLTSVVYQQQTFKLRQPIPYQYDPQAQRLVCESLRFEWVGTHKEAVARLNQHFVNDFAKLVQKSPLQKTPDEGQRWLHYQTYLDPNLWREYFPVPRLVQGQLVSKDETGVGVQWAGLGETERFAFAQAREPAPWDAILPGHGFEAKLLRFGDGTFIWKDLVPKELLQATSEEIAAFDARVRSRNLPRSTWPPRREP